MSNEVTAQCSSQASKIHYVLGNQSCNSGVVGAEIAGGTAAGYPWPNTAQYGLDDAPYYGGSLPAQSGSLAAQAAAYATLFFGYSPPLVGPPGTGCINNGTVQRLRFWGRCWLQQYHLFL